MSDRTALLQELRDLATAEPFNPFMIVAKSGDFPVLRPEDICFLLSGDPKIRAHDGNLYPINSQWISFAKKLDAKPEIIHDKVDEEKDDR